MTQEAKEMENSERLAVVETELKQLNNTINAMNDKLDVWNKSYGLEMKLTRCLNQGIRKSERFKMK